MAGRVDRAYLERRIQLCRDKAAAQSDPGLARVYRNFAEQYAKALAEELASAGTEAPPAAAPPFMLSR